MQGERGGIALKAILAVDDANGIGKGGELPWPMMPADMAFFKSMTLGRPVIMGRKTYQSLPPKVQPLLPGRLNVVLSKSCPRDLMDGDRCPAVFPTISSALSTISAMPYPEAFIIGGASLYNDAEVVNSLEEVYLTRVAGNYCCDTFAEGLVAHVKKTFHMTWCRHTNDGNLHFQKWTRYKVE